MKLVDLFAGSGGLSLGFQLAKRAEYKFNILAAYETWEQAIETYKRNFDHQAFQMDLQDTQIAISHIEQFEPDILIGGPPCQDFSQAGKRAEGERANLTISFAEIVKAIKPRWFLMENVDRARNSKSYKTARQIFKNAGYGLTEIAIDASRCGVPQKRMRVFCIGRQGEEDGFLFERIVRHLSEKRMTLRDYFGDRLGIDHFYRHPKNYNRRAVFSVDEPAPTIRGVNRPIPDGYPGHKNDTGCVKSTNIRSLTTLERATIQTFPRSFVWSGSKTDQKQQIGNAVPVKLAEFMATRILEFEAVRTGKVETLRAGKRRFTDVDLLLAA